jgi:hypothetical protein
MDASLEHTTLGSTISTYLHLYSKITNKFKKQVQTHFLTSFAPSHSSVIKTIRLRPQFGEGVPY